MIYFYPEPKNLAMKKAFNPGLIFLLTLLLNCSTRENASTVIDYETLSKDETFRASIKTGNFIKLSAGYTYFEFDNRSADTVLVLVHGFSVPSYIWDSTYRAAIKRGYGALRYDTYGRGNSDNPDVVYDVAFFSNQLKELLDSLKITKPVNLVGLSDGGRTISAFAFQYPTKVKNLIYVDAAGFSTLTDSVAHPALVSDEEIMAFKRERYPTMARGQMTDFYDSIPFRGWDKKYQQLMQYKGFIRALISTNKNRTDLTMEHKKIAASNVPVFAIWGEYDTVVKLEDVRTNLMNRIPNVKLFVIPKAGHLPHMEQTAQFNSILFEEIMGK
jgi:pimeloyl-ACP methyl ester carboxylesterase